MAETKARSVIVRNPQGMHARPADLFVKIAQSYPCTVEIVKGGLRVDGKSILDILTLAAVEGTTLSIEATGENADAALEALVRLVEKNFEE